VAKTKKVPVEVKKPLIEEPLPTFLVSEISDIKEKFHQIIMKK